MSQQYYGRIGKNGAWGLLADERIVVWSKGKTYSDFSAVETIQEIGSDEVVFFWDNGKWNKVDFLVIHREQAPASLYFGRIGANNGHGLLADKRTIEWKDKTFYLDNGVWNQVDFSVERGSREPVTGFCD